jgi:hypothetical protein
MAGDHSIDRTAHIPGATVDFSVLYPGGHLVDTLSLFTASMPAKSAGADIT